MSRTRPIPTGTVTLLFTDVEGSTRLWESEPAAMAPALRRHDEILRGAIEATGGYVFKTVGDAFCAAFSTPTEAIGAVLAAQQALLDEPWPTQRAIRVRMGLHTGVCEERDEDYFGPVVNRAARLESVAHGGQVLLSGATAELLSESLDDGIRLRDLGLHRLKDLGRPEQIFQLEAAFLPAAFPPVRSLDNPELSNNLPELLSVFIGRDRELEELRGLVESSRLVTLTGAGGSGKTRLALHAAAELLDASPDGVWFVELASLSEPERVPAAVAVVLGLQDQGRESLPDELVEALSEQHLLLVLDNCEHLIDATAKFADTVVRRCPRVRVIATSREPLGIDGERVYRVPSLSLPDKDADGVEDLADSDAVELFVARARVHDAAFVLDETVAPLLASICWRLDGIPLALELAAARLSAMSLVHLSERLDQRFRLLTGGSRNALPRQQTLQAMVDWSFDLLNRPEQAVLRRLSVFVGGFELEAAEAICETEGVDSFDVADLLRSLVDKSLVVADREAGSVRYRLLETIRQYCAQDLLRSEGESEVLQARDRHAAFYLALAEAAAPELTRSGQAEWLKRLDRDWDNVRATIACFSADPSHTEEVLRLGVALQRFLMSRGHADALPYLRSALDEADQSPRPVLLEALVAASMMVSLLLGQKDATEMAHSKELAERAVPMARTLGDRRAEARALEMLSGAAYLQQDSDTARRLGEQAVAIARTVGDVGLLGEMLRAVAISVADPKERRRLREEALDCFRQAGDALYATGELYSLAGLDILAESMEDARSRLEEAIALAEDLGAQLFLYFFRSDLGILLVADGDFERASGLLRHCLMVARRSGFTQELSGLLFGSACCATSQGDHLRAARLHGAADVAIAAAIEGRNISWTPMEDRLREADRGRLRSAMGEEAFVAICQEGAALTRQQAVDLALGRDAGT